MTLSTGQLRPADPVFSAVRAFNSFGDLTYIADKVPEVEQRPHGPGAMDSGLVRELERRR